MDPNTYNIIRDIVLNNDREMLDRYNDLGCDLNQKSSDGQTPVHIAAEWNRKHMLRRLIELGANTNMGNDTGDTPLHIAVSSGNVYCAILLCSCNRTDINISNLRGETPIFVACSFSNIECLDLLINKGADANIASNKGKTPMVVSASNRIVKKLLKYGADANIADSKGRTILMNAVADDDERRVEMLLEYEEVRNALDAIDSDGRTAIHFATKCNRITCQYLVSLLVKNGANIDVVDTKKGWTALNMACSMKYSWLKNYFIKIGADANIASNIDGSTPLHNAVRICAARCHGPHLHCSVPQLLQYGVNVDVVDNKGCTALMIAIESHDPDEIEYHDEHYARVGDVEKLLVEKGANINIVNNEGKTAIDIASEKNYGALVTYLSGLLVGHVG